jgi:hypothetical protein
MAALSYSAIYQALYQQVVMSQLINPGSIIGNFVTITLGFLIMIAGAYLFSAGILQLNRSRSNRV